jgi:hypothetical protein
MLALVISLALVAAAAIGLALAMWSRARAAGRARDEANSAREAALAGREAADREAAERAQDAGALVDEATLRRGIDADVLWQLERERSERTWRHSVAVGPTTSSVFDGVDDVLREALQVELDAAREEVGCVVDLHAELPPNVTVAASLLTLRSAQELLARAVKAADKTTLQVRTDGEDLIVTVHAVDTDDSPITVEPLAFPPSPDIEPTEGGVRIVDAVAASSG